MTISVNELFQWVVIFGGFLTIGVLWSEVSRLTEQSNKSRKFLSERGYS